MFYVENYAEDMFFKLGLSVLILNEFFYMFLCIKSAVASGMVCVRF